MYLFGGHWEPPSGYSTKTTEPWSDHSILATEQESAGLASFFIALPRTSHTQDVSGDPSNSDGYYVELIHAPGPEITKLG